MELNALSNPFLVAVQPERLHSDGRKPAALSLRVTTLNLRSPGTMSIILFAECSAKHIYLGKLSVRQSSYGGNSRTLRFELGDLVAVTSRLPRNLAPHARRYHIETVLTREDGKRTNPVMIDVTDLFKTLQVIEPGHTG